MMADRSLGLIFWRVLDELDYLFTLTRLRILDALCGEGVEVTFREQEHARVLSAPFSVSAMAHSVSVAVVAAREPTPT